MQYPRLVFIIATMMVKVLSGLQNPAVTEARNSNQFGTNFVGSAEPIYGTQFLPRKFKIAVTVPGDNSVDLFTNDLGIVVITDDKGELQGYNIVVGGGMGRTHRFPPFPYYMYRVYANQITHLFR